LTPQGFYHRDTEGHREENDQCRNLNDEEVFSLGFRTSSFFLFPVSVFFVSLRLKHFSVAAMAAPPALWQSMPAHRGAGIAGSPLS
jgi:hypothetical protein